MDEPTAIAARSALAQDTRMAMFRRLVRAGPDGMAAGDVAAAVGAVPSTLSHHLGLLERAGLVTSTRDGRLPIYAAADPSTRWLLSFLMEDCCQGVLEICGLPVPALSCTDACCKEKPPLKRLHVPCRGRRPRPLDRLLLHAVGGPSRPLPSTTTPSGC